MRRIKTHCRTCKKETTQTAVVESWLDVSGFSIFISYWRRCNECDNVVFARTKEIESEQL